MNTIGWIALAVAGLVVLFALELLLVGALARRTWVIVNAWYGSSMFRVRARDVHEALRIAHTMNGMTPPLYAVTLHQWKARKRAEARAIVAANRKVGRR